MFGFYILIVLLLLCRYGFSTEHLLILGDSLDRLGLEAFCQYHVGNLSCIIHRSSSAAAADAESYYSCTLSNGDSVAAIHLYGSKPEGPYAYPCKNRIPDDNTNYRLTYAMNHHTAHFGPPTRIILNVGLWDVSATTTRGGNETMSSEMQSMILANYVNLNQRLDDIFELIHHNRSIDVGLRTTAWSWHFADAVIEVNNNVRRIARERKLTLYDLDLYVWSMYNYDTRMLGRLFQDEHHPHVIILRKGVEAMLGYRYNAFYSYRGIARSNPCEISYHDDLQSMRRKLLDARCRLRYTVELVHPASSSLLSAQMIEAHRAVGELMVNNISYRQNLIQQLIQPNYSQLSYLDWRSPTTGFCRSRSAVAIQMTRYRFMNLTESFLHTHLFGFGDIFFMPLEVYSEIPAEAITVSPSYESCMIDLLSHYCDEIPPAIRIHIEHCEEYYILLKHAGFIELSQVFYNNLQVSSSRSFNLTSLSLAPALHISHDHNLIRFYRNEEVLFKHRGGSEVMTVIDGQIRSFYSGDAFARRGHDFDQVIDLPREFHSAVLPSLSKGEYIK
jgi:hypothetical protein